MDFIKCINTINTISGNGIAVKPVIHFRMEILSRGKGFHSSAVGYAAYCAGRLLYNENNDRVYNWSKRKDVIFSKIMLPENAPSRYANRKILWNEVEKNEKNKNAQLARTLIIALPTEFSTDTQKRLVCQYVQDVFVNRGMCADINLHDNGTGNPHAHIILTMRSIDKDGKWMAKQKKVYRLDENGEKIYDRVKRQYKCTTQKINDWDEPHNVEQWREKWAEVCNVEFARLGLSKRLTHESYQRQGVDLIPTKHLGSVSASMERKGVRTKAGEKNQHIYLQNVKMIIDMTYKTLCKLMEKAKQMLQQLKRQMKHERSEQKQIFYCEQLPLLLCNMEHEKPKIPHSLLHNTEHEKPKICRYARKYQQYERKYIRPPSRSFVPSL